MFFVFTLPLKYCGNIIELALSFFSLAILVIFRPHSSFSYRTGSRERAGSRKDKLFEPSAAESCCLLGEQALSGRWAMQSCSFLHTFCISHKKDMWVWGQRPME
jgi:hypothetical protein